MSNTEGHALYVIEGHLKGDVGGGEGGKFIFTQRVVSVWNALPGMVVTADKIGEWKRLLDKLMNMLKEWRDMDQGQSEGISLILLHVQYNIEGRMACSSAVLSYVRCSMLFLCFMF